MKKRILALFLVLIMLCTSLTSCGLFEELVELANNIFDLLPDDPNEKEDTHNYWFQFIIPDPKRCTKHAIVSLPSIAPTCNAPGASGGQVCQKCGAVIVPQEELAPLEHEYSDNEDEKCNRCGYERKIYCEHLETEKIPEIAPTCTTKGRTEGEKCVKCEKIVSGYEVISIIPHDYEDDKDATCNVCGYERKLECTHEATEKINAKKPTCTEVGLTEGAYCAHCGEITIVQEEISTIPHTEGDWLVGKAPTETEKGEKHTECTVCGTVIRTAEIDVIDPNANSNASQGLVYSLNPDGNSYSLIDLGTCTDTTVVIASYYEGLPVTRIADSTFMGKTHIDTIVIPEGILNIGSGAFRGCSYLANITIPSTVTSIGSFAFYGCESLVEIKLPSEITTIEEHTFYACHNLKSIEIPYGLKSIEKYAFYGCVSLESINLPASLEKIGSNAFYYTGIKTMVIPNSVKSIEGSAFCIGSLDGESYVKSKEGMNVTLFKGTSKLGAYVFPKNTVIDFRGTAAEWNDIFINPMNYNYKVVCSDKTFIH